MSPQVHAWASGGSFLKSGGIIAEELNPCMRLSKQVRADRGRRMVGIGKVGSGPVSLRNDRREDLCSPDQNIEDPNVILE